MTNTGQILNLILGFTVAILLTQVCEVKTNDFPETSIASQFSYTDEPLHHIRQRRAELFTDYMAEIEIHASSISVIDDMKRYQEQIRLKSNLSIGGEVITISDANITTVCNLSATDYQCKCEDQYFWPCDKCDVYGSCSTTNDTCSCINARPIDGQYCQPISEMTTITACAQPPTVIRMSLRINETFDTSLTNANHQNYKDKAEKIKSAIENGYGTLPNYIKGSAKVTGFRSGSIIADYTINATTNNLDFTSANALVSSNLLSNGTILTPDAFALTEQKNLSTTTDKIYPQQTVTLSCPLQSVEGTIKWIVNENDPDSKNHNISIDGRTLVVNNASESDNGRYSCYIQTTSIPYIQWQHIAIEQQPIITVGDSERLFPCDGRTVQLTCCVNTGYNIEWVLGSNVQTSGSGCITVDHNITNGNCKDETFACRLKDLPQLLGYGYSTRSVTVKTSTENFVCKDDKLGFGETDEMTEGACENNKEGSITYKCELGKWKPILDNCVLKVIKDLESQAQILVVEQIPEFVESLSNETMHFSNEIIQSPVTVQTIVEILVKIANVSQNITIHEPVIKDFLNTVDLIISDKSNETWKELNNRSTTSIELLRAIETISGHLSNVDFNFTKSSIQLNRTTIDRSFSIVSQLPDSNTRIVIPDVPNSTYITIIFFTNLDNVLPTRNTSTNDSRTSENHINGDVVVVKVNQTINNILFTFDITNKSLGNPQCVYWNFDLNHWDSTGCKVKLLENETGKVTCECNHTTSFSILMSPFPIQNLVLDYITYIGVAISIASLILCLIIEMIVWKSVTRNDTAYMRHVSIVNIAVSLLIADIWFIIGAAVANPGELKLVDACNAVVFFMHFFYLAVFFWMLFSALLLLYRTVMVLSQMSRTNMMVIAFTVGYCAPLLIAVITVASTVGLRRYIWTRDACWLNWNDSKALLAFVIPALTIVAFNLLVLIVVLYKMLRRGVGATSRPDDKHALKVIVRCVAILTPIFGLTWGFGIGTMMSPDFAMHVVFAILNSFQGFFVLVFGTLLDSKVREALAGMLSLKNLSSSPTRSTDAGTSSGLGFFVRLRRRKVYNTSDPRPSTASNSSCGSETLMNP